MPCVRLAQNPACAGGRRRQLALRFDHCSRSLSLLRSARWTGLSSARTAAEDTGDAPALPISGAPTPRMIVSRSRPPVAALRLAEALGADLVEMGSAGAKTMAVVRGECEIYAHSGGQYEWDSCAPVAVAAAAGCHVSRIDGSPLRYNQRDVYLPDLLVCRPELADAALTALASFEH